MSTNKDPYVWALYNGTLHFNNLNECYSYSAIWLILSALLMSVIPIIFYFKCGAISEEEIRQSTLVQTPLKHPEASHSYRI